MFHFLHQFCFVFALNQCVVQIFSCSVKQCDEILIPSKTFVNLLQQKFVTKSSAVCSLHLSRRGGLFGFHCPEISFCGVGLNPNLTFDLTDVDFSLVRDGSASCNVFVDTNFLACENVTTLLMDKGFIRGIRKC